MENEIKIYKVRIVDKITYVLDENGIEVSENDLNQMGLTKCFDLKTLKVIDYDDTEDKKLERLQELRAMREPLLIAFDKYKSNVNYGVEFETAEQRDEIVSWYNSILNLEGTAFEIIPERIRYYL